MSKQSTLHIAGFWAIILLALAPGIRAANISWTTLDYPGVGANATAAQGISGSTIVGDYNVAGNTHGFIYDI